MMNISQFGSILDRIQVRCKCRKVLSSDVLFAFPFEGGYHFEDFDQPFEVFLRCRSCGSYNKIDKVIYDHWEKFSQDERDKIIREVMMNKKEVVENVQVP